MPEDVPVLSYKSEIYKEDTEVSGPISVKLFAAIDKEDAHFTTRIWDVNPGGRRLLLSTVHLKASHREPLISQETHRIINNHKSEIPVVPGTINEYQFEMAPIGHIFEKGHSLELEIKTMDQQYFSYFEVASLPRLYTSGRVAGPHPLASEVKFSIYKDGNYPSHIILPVVMGEKHWINKGGKESENKNKLEILDFEVPDYWDERYMEGIENISLRKYDVIKEENVRMKVRDGTTLAVYIYRPDKDNDEEFPGLVAFFQR